MRACVGHLFSLTLIAAVAALAAMAPGASAARPLDIEHFGPTVDTFPDELCGIAGTSTTRFVGNFKLYADGTFLSTGNFRQLFTADATGKQVLNSGIEQTTGPFDPTDNGNGTITETFTFKGLPMKVSLAGGPILVRDAGNATVAITFALNPDGSPGDVLSQSILTQHGPHPQLDNDAAFCSVVVAALT